MWTWAAKKQGISCSSEEREILQMVASGSLGQVPRPFSLKEQEKMKGVNRLDWTLLKNLKKKGGGGAGGESAEAAPFCVFELQALKRGGENLKELTRTTGKLLRRNFQCLQLRKK